MKVPDERRREAQQVRAFIESPTWEWLQSHLMREQGKLIVLATRPGITGEDRAVLCGKLALVTEILHRPKHLMTVAEEAEKAIDQTPYKHPAAPVGTTSKF